MKPLSRRAHVAPGLAGWGSNNRFSFPASGGTGEIYRRLAMPLQKQIDFRRTLVSIDPEAKLARFGGEEPYDALVSTMPLDRLMGLVAGVPGQPQALTEMLRHSGVYTVGVGFEAPLDDDKCWMYYPDERTPLYRATNFARYSPANVPTATRSATAAT